MKPHTLAAALLLPLAAATQAAPLLDISDPAGDDHGDGALVYPRDSAFTPGDLDLRSLRAFAEGNEVRFEAQFRNPVRDPAGVHSDSLGSEDLAQFARRGFYAFNLDVYIDTDRVSGSGNTLLLPGRGARLDPGSAWEKAVVLTPRPELMRRQLRDALGGTAEIDAALDASVAFATQVRVRGRSISFSVPRAFFGGADLGRAAITAVVTAAKLSVESDLFTGLGGQPPAHPLERLTLGVQPPAAGRPVAAMGYDGQRAPATAIVDLLAPEPQAQAQQLAAGAVLRGVATTPGLPAVAGGSPVPWFTRAMATAMAPAAAAAPAVVAPVAAPVAAPAPAPVSTPVPAPAAAAPVVAAPVPAAAPAAAPPAATKPRDAAFYEEQEQRLRTLKRLHDAKLISDAEYEAKRREILGAL